MTCKICAAVLPIREGKKKSDVMFCSDKCRGIDYHNRRVVKAMKKLTDFGFEYISGDYITSHSKISVRNPRCGHTFDVQYNNLFTNPNYCPACGNAIKYKKLSARNKLGCPPKAKAKWDAYNEKQRLDAIARRQSPEWNDWQMYAYIARSKSFSNYTKHTDKIDPNRIRSPEFHIDHIVPVSYCFKNNIPVELCYSVENLTMSSAKENCGRKDKLNERAIELLEKWNINQ